MTRRIVRCCLSSVRTATATSRATCQQITQGYCGESDLKIRIVRHCGTKPATVRSDNANLKIVYANMPRALKDLLLSSFSIRDESLVESLAKQARNISRNESGSSKSKIKRKIICTYRLFVRPAKRLSSMAISEALVFGRPYEALAILAPPSNDFTLSARSRTRKEGSATGPFESSCAVDFRLKLTGNLGI